MIDFLKIFFSNIDASKIVTFLFVFLVLFCIYGYAKKQNMFALAYLEMGLFIILFLLSLVIEKQVTLLLLAFCMIATVVATATAFSAEIRHDLFRISWRKPSIGDIGETVDTDQLRQSVEAITKACQDLSKNDVGAIIVIGDDIPETVLDSGTRIDSDISSEMIEVLFYPKAPLHDGAVIISNNRIVSAGCYLPLTQTLALPRELGTRHRAAIGISETDPRMTVIVVSEETGIISAVHEGKIKRYLDVDSLQVVLELAFGLTDKSEETIVWGE